MGVLDTLLDQLADAKNERDLLRRIVNWYERREKNAADVVRAHAPSVEAMTQALKDWDAENPKPEIPR